jgi:hypothetical protein
MRLATTSVLVSIAAMSALVMAPRANAQSITNATQLSVNLAPITMSGVKQGGSASVSGAGLGTVAAPTLSATGAFTTATPGTAPVVGSSFSYAVSGYSADEAAIATNITDATPLPSTGTYGVQSGSFTSAIAGGALNITGAGVASTTAATTVGATVSAASSTSLTNGSTSTSYQRSASSTNAQSSFSAERQGSSASLSGSAVVAATLPTLTLAGSIGDAPIVAAGTGSTNGGTVSLGVTAGQDGVGLVAVSNASVAIPIYGKVTTTLGGTTAGLVGGTGGFNVNSLGVANAGSAGTSQSLTAVNSFSVFDK